MIIMWSDWELTWNLKQAFILFYMKVPNWNLIPIRIGKERNGKDPREKKKRSLLWLRCMRRLGGWIVLLWRSFIKKDGNSLTGAADCDCIRIKNHLYVACSLVKRMLPTFLCFQSLKLSTYKSPRWVESYSNQLAFLLLPVGLHCFIALAHMGFQFQPSCEYSMATKSV